MGKIKIVDLKPGLISCVDVQMPSDAETYKEGYFEWTASNLVAKFNTSEVSGGVLYTWHHIPAFSEIETHLDAEMFYFISGTAIMLFVDLVDGRPSLKTAQIVRIKPGTQIIIDAGKGHFVAVAEGSEPVNAVVIAPKMDAPRVGLPERVEGIT